MTVNAKMPGRSWMTKTFSLHVWVECAHIGERVCLRVWWCPFRRESVWGYDRIWFSSMQLANSFPSYPENWAKNFGTLFSWITPKHIKFPWCALFVKCLMNFAKHAWPRSWLNLAFKLFTSHFHSANLVQSLFASPIAIERFMAISLSRRRFHLKRILFACVLLLFRN